MFWKIPLQEGRKLLFEYTLKIKLKFNLFLILGGDQHIWGGPEKMLQCIYDTHLKMAPVKAAS